MTSAYERSEYYESRLVNMSKDVDKVAQKLQTNKGAVNDVKVLKEAMKNMLTTPEGEQLGIRNASQFSLLLWLMYYDVFKTYTHVR